jgi:poly(A) polymerase
MTPKLHKNWIDPFAIQIIKALQEAGFEAYLVGGCVRDLLVGLHPKDYDIATNASPQQVRRKIYNSYIIGRRFRLVLVRRGETLFEVATFRRSGTAEEVETPEAQEESAVVGDNFFGSREEDAKRRDFTINALLYDPINNELIDYCNGNADIENRCLRMIGDAPARLVEDPIRILRAVRLSQKLNFSLEESLRSAIVDKSEELLKSALPRRREEFLKFLRLENSPSLWTELYDLGVLKVILPGLHAVFEDAQKQDIFLSGLRRWSQFDIDPQNTLEMFAAFLQIFILAYYGEDADIAMLQEDPRLQIMVRDQLGVFKNESGVFFQALQLKSALLKTDDYLRRGERRRRSILDSEFFNLAFKLGCVDLSLTPALQVFWLQEKSR